MAMFEKQNINGIQLGNALDFCLECKKAGISERDQDFEYKEVFKLRINGLDHCLCMKHLKELLKGYKLVKDTKKTTDIITIPKELAINGTIDDVIAYIEKEIE